MIETALAVALLTSGGLLLETFWHLRNTDLGVRREQLLTFETPLFPTRTSIGAMPSAPAYWREYERFPV